MKFLTFCACRFGLFGKDPKFKIRALLNLPPTYPMETARRKVGDIGLRKAYIENLRLVLKYVAMLVEILSGVIIVTTDHGELLGEDGCYDHPKGSKNLLLREIPLLRIEKKENKKEIEEKKRINLKIKRLKASNLI